MGSTETGDRRSRKPYTQRQASTVFLRVPYQEWPAVKRGHKREFRGSPGAVSGLMFVTPPIPVVGYATGKQTGHDSRLLVLEETWKEPLGAISAESLEAEGYPSLPHFRRAWMQRTKKRFRPNAIVTVYRVRPFEELDIEMFSRSLFDRLYGEFLGNGNGQGGP